MIYSMCNSQAHVDSQYEDHLVSLSNSCLPRNCPKCPFSSLHQHQRPPQSQRILLNIHSTPTDPPPPPPSLAQHIHRPQPDCDIYAPTALLCPALLNGISCLPDHLSGEVIGHQPILGSPILELIHHTYQFRQRHLSTQLPRQQRGISYNERAEQYLAHDNGRS